MHTSPHPHESAPISKATLATCCLLVIGAMLSASMFVGELTGDLIVVIPVFALLALSAIPRFRVAPITVPSRVVSVMVALYLLVSLASVAVSISTATSVKYVLGSSAVILLAFVSLPALLGRRLHFLLAWATLLAGVALVLLSFILLVAGPVHTVGGSAGVYLPVDVVLFDHTTPFTLPLLTGIYATPGDQALALALAVVAGVGLLTGNPVPRARGWLIASIALCALGLALTFSRTGWIVVCFGLAAIGVALAVRRRVSVTVAVLLVASVALTGALLTSRLTVNARFDVLADRYGTKIADELLGETHATTDLVTGTDGTIEQTEQVQLKGGADSSSRRILWEASLDAIADRPVLGHGLGTDADAIAPHLSGDATVYRGLTSHSTVLRAGVEGGVLLLSLLIGLVAISVFRAGALVVRRRVVLSGGPLAVSAVIIALVPALFTETLLLGGLTLISIIWTLSAGAIVGSDTDELG